MRIISTVAYVGASPSAKSRINILAARRFVMSHQSGVELFNAASQPWRYSVWKRSPCEDAFVPLVRGGDYNARLGCWYFL